MKKKSFIFAIPIALMFSSNSFGQGCETLLMNGVFNTFNAYSGNYSSAEWHNYWCSGVVEQVNSNYSNGACLNLGVTKIALGMSFDDAKEFQRIYKSINCSTNAGYNENYSTNLAIQKIASPEILKAYIDCKKLQSSGLIVDLNVRSEDNKVFVIDVKYTGAWQIGAGPKVKKVTFLPNLVSTKEGSLQDGVELKNGQTFSMICERSAEYPVTVYIETEVGTFHANLAPTIPPPTEQEKIMSSMPKGTIIGWFDPLKLPKGWVLCDGNNGTPNLVDRFPFGTSFIASNIGSMIGFKEHTHSVSGITAYENKNRNARDANGFQGEGPDCMLHTHNFTTTTNTSENIPPSTRIIFIMKL